MGIELRIAFALILLLLSFFFSSAESVYSTVDRYRLQRDQETNKRNSGKVLKIARNYDEMVATVLFGNNLVNISLTALVTGIALTFDKSMGQTFTLITGALIVSIIIFGEIIPKTIGVKYNYTLAYGYYYLYRLFAFIFTPVLLLFRLAQKIFNKKQVNIVHSEEVYTEEELQIIVDEIEEQGLIDEETSDLVRSAIELTETEAYEIMTPRVDILALDIDDDIFAAIKEQKIFNYSRIPVYEHTIDNIIGILSTKDLIKLTLGKRKIDMRTLIKAPLFVHHSKNISEILTEFKASKNHIAVVIDEYGGTEGIVTLEDILEEVIGEIWDESDEIDEPIIELSPTHFIVDGGVNIEDFFELFELDEDDDNDYDTVAGWCLEILDRFAKVGDEFTYESIRVKIIDVDGFVVEKVEVFVTDEDN